jgi:hypothetical protein
MIGLRTNGIIGFGCASGRLATCDAVLRDAVDRPGRERPESAKRFKAIEDLRDSDIKISLCRGLAGVELRIN